LGIAKPDETPGAESGAPAAGLGSVASDRNSLSVSLQEEILDLVAAQKGDE
jgi:hypothetical protein